MPQGKSMCPVCKGRGTVKENDNRYEFVTRDPATNRCLICDGSGVVNVNVKLPNGEPVQSIMPGKSAQKAYRAHQRSKRLTGERVSEITGEDIPPERKRSSEDPAAREGKEQEPSLAAQGMIELMLLDLLPPECTLGALEEDAKAIAEIINNRWQRR